VVASSGHRNIRRHPYRFYQKLGYVIAGMIPDGNGFNQHQGDAIPLIVVRKRSDGIERVAFLCRIANKARRGDPRWRVRRCRNGSRPGLSVIREYAPKTIRSECMLELVFNTPHRGILGHANRLPGDQFRRLSVCKTVRLLPSQPF
jgi:hypothetical protein